MSLNKRFTGDFTIESIDSGNTLVMNGAGGVELDTNTATPTIAVTALTVGVKYRIISPGDTNFTLIGAEDSDAGTLFIATDVGIGTGTVKASLGLTIIGDLTVLGNATAIESIDTEIVDNIIVLNSGEVGPGVTAGFSGIEIDRGDGVTVGQEPAGIRFNEGTDGWEINNGTGAGGWLDITTGSAGITAVVDDLAPQLGGDLDVNGWTITSAAAGDIVIVADTTGLVKIDQEISLKEQAAPILANGVALYNKLSAGTIGAGGTGLYFVNDTETDELVSKKKAMIYGLIF